MALNRQASDISDDFVEIDNVSEALTLTTLSEPRLSMLSSFPVLVPEDEALFFDQEKFGAYVESKLRPRSHAAPKTAESRFMKGLQSAKAVVGHGNNPPNKMRTQNNAVTNESTEDARLDLFTEMEKSVGAERLEKLLEDSWAVSPIDTLKIVFNARSIHLGKGEKSTFYQALGWMREKGHVQTVLQNLTWIQRPVIQKKVPKKDEDGDAVMVDERPEVKSLPADDYDVPNGVSHGYWKDLLNILTLEVTDSFKVAVDPQSILAPPNGQKQAKIEDRKRKREQTKRAKGSRGQPRDSRVTVVSRDSVKERIPREARLDILRGRAITEKEAARVKRQEVAKARHDRFLKAWNKPDGFYKALHLTVARLFAEQLKKDLLLLKSGKKSNINKISLAAKWAPSLEHFHDRNNFIASSIAELLHPAATVAQPGDTREVYLKRARELYRGQTLSPLRKALQIVERDISANAFENIDYERVPSLAMNNYKDLFAQKDLERFESYIEKVASGDAQISGAVLLPSVMVHEAQNGGYSVERTGSKPPTGAALLKQKKQELLSKTASGQWNTLVKRIKDSGSLSSAIAVCDVSGSMTWPQAADGTTPMDSAIGLSLLLAEVTAPPFGGSMITFSHNPAVVSVGGASDSRSFSEKVAAISSMDAGMNTDFEAVFLRLILPMAKKHNLKKEEMVKTLFVFSDMQFDESLNDYTGSKPRSRQKWETTYEVIKREYEKAGYDMPDMVFWNLAARVGGGNSAAAKPVTKDVPGTALVSGYSQAMLKTFLDGGLFDEGVEEEIVEVTNEDGTVAVEKRTKEPMTPLKVMEKAIGHKAYEMLEVVD